MADKSNTLDQSTFDKLRRLYIIALSAIALSLIISQILIRRFLNDQESDSRVVNVAGRQRMLSQKLAKEVLLIDQAKTTTERKTLIGQLKHTQKLWANSHLALQRGNDTLGLPGNSSLVVATKFQKLEPYYRNILASSSQIIRAVEQNPSQDLVALTDEVNQIAQNENFFLTIMDDIVNQYDIEAKDKISRLRRLELLIMAITMLILLGEFLFIFWPTATAVKNTLKELLLAEKKAKKMAQDADILSASKEQSVRELRGLSQAMNQAILFARIDTDGFITHMGDRFSKLFKYRKISIQEKLSDVLSIYENEQVAIESLITQYKKTGWQGEVKGTTKDKKNVWLEMSLIPFSIGSNGIDTAEILVICFNITERKKAQLEIERLATASYEEKMQQQKIVSRQIIENQENEQNRIAKDLHDGIGQMLTGLKFNLESIDMSFPEKASAKIENIKELSSNIIKGVRTATFNLAPPELTDYGIVSAISKLTQELSKLTSKNIILFNKTDFNKRLDSLVEINIYRITQEAINNAIKYADSSHIIITITHSDTILSITIDDNGKGFDSTLKKPKKNIDGGMGMTFMRERMSYINGRLFVSSEIGKGTRITLNIPIP